MQWPSNLCRICGHHRVCQLISEEMGEKMKKYLNINIAFGPEFKPQHVCFKCSIKLMKFADFINLCHKNDLKFDCLYQKCLEICQREKHGYSMIKLNKSTNGILESRSKDAISVSKLQVKNTKKICPSSFHRCQNFNNQCRKSKMSGINKFQTFPKRSVPETNVKSRVLKEQEKSFMKSTENIYFKKKCEHSRYFIMHKKLEKIKQSPSQASHSSKLINT